MDSLLLYKFVGLYDVIFQSNQVAVMNKLTQVLLLLCAIQVVAHDDCVPSWRAREIVPAFQKLFSDGNVNRIKDTVTSDFTVYSDSQEFTTPGITPVCRPNALKFQHHSHN